MVTAVTQGGEARISQGAVPEVFSIEIFSIMEGFCSYLESHREDDDGEVL
jgi:hypothetical protein